MEQEEIWKDIDGFEGYYQVSNMGRVKSLDRFVKHNWGGYKLNKGKILKSYSKNGTNYEFVVLCVKNKRRMKSVHRLVAEAFMPNPENKPEVNHISGSKIDNRIQNLEWCTRSENQLHAFANNLKCSNGTKHSQHKLSNEDIIFIRSLESNWSATQSDLADLFGVSRASIGDIWSSRTWKHIL